MAFPPYTPLDRPDAAIQHLADIISNTPDEYRQHLHLSNGERLVPDARYIYSFYSDGIIAVRQGKPEMLIHLGHTPWLFGTSTLFSGTDSVLMLTPMTAPGAGPVVIEAVGPVNGWQMEASRFQQLVSEHKAWSSVVAILTFYLHFSINRFSLQPGDHHYAVIRTLILEFSRYPAFVQMSMPLAKYIMERTNISRSSTMKIISMLKKRGYITLHRGRLIDVNNKLPDELW